MIRLNQMRLNKIRLNHKRLNLIKLNQMKRNQWTHGIGSNEMKEKVESSITVPPKIPEPLDEMDLSGIPLAHDDAFALISVNNCLIEDQKADHLSFRQCVFNNVVFREISF